MADRHPTRCRIHRLLTPGITGVHRPRRGVGAPQPRHAAARPIRGAVLMVPRLPRGRGDAGALGRVSESSNPHWPAASGPGRSQRWRGRRYPRWRTSSSLGSLSGPGSPATPNKIGDRLSIGCGEPAGTVGDVVTGLGCGTGTYLHRMPEPRSPIPHGPHGAHRRRDRGRDPAPSSRAWRLPARGLPTARGETPGPAPCVRAGRPAGRFPAHPVVTGTSGWHLKRRGR